MSSLQKNLKNIFCTPIVWIFKNVILLPIVLILWCLMALLDAIVLLFSSENCYHRFVIFFYKKYVTTYLTNKPFSTTSYTVTHGFIYVIVVTVAVFLGLQQCSPSAKIIKTKHIKITVTSDTQDSIEYFIMYIRPDWSLNKDSLDQTFQLRLFPTYNHLSDTAKFRVDIETNFDIDLQSLDDKNITDSTCTKRHFKYNLHSFKGQQILYYEFLSDTGILNDSETPYVNLYIEFNRLPLNNALMPLLSDSTLTDSTFLKAWWYKRDSYDMAVWINLGEEALEQKRRQKKNADVLPYDLLSIKPEPVNNDPFYIDYNTPEKQLEVVDKGLFISVVNRDLEAELEQKAFFRSVLIGTLISIIFTLILKLFGRWKEMNEKNGKKNPYDD